MGEGVGEMGSAVAEIVATGDGIPPVGKGVGRGGSEVRTSTLNVQPEIKKTIAVSHPVNVFIIRSFGREILDRWLLNGYSLFQVPFSDCRLTRGNVSIPGNDEGFVLEEVEARKESYPRSEKP